MIQPDPTSGTSPLPLKQPSLEKNTQEKSIIPSPHHEPDSSELDLKDRKLKQILPSKSEEVLPKAAQVKQAQEAFTLKIMNRMTPPHLLAERADLQAKWKETPIYDLTEAAADACFQEECYTDVSLCLFTWPEDNSKELILSVGTKNESLPEQYRILVTENGRLLFDGHFFNSPSGLIKYFSEHNKSKPPYVLFKPLFHSVLGKYLNGVAPVLMNRKTSLTLAVMMANKDYLAAKNLIDRFMYVTKEKEARQLFLGFSLQQILNDGHEGLLEDFIRNYNPSDYLNERESARLINVIDSFNNKSLSAALSEKEKRYPQRIQRISLRQKLTYLIWVSLVPIH